MSGYPVPMLVKGVSQMSHVMSRANMAFDSAMPSSTTIGQCEAGIRFPLRIPLRSPTPITTVLMDLSGTAIVPLSPFRIRTLVFVYSVSKRRSPRLRSR